MSNIKTKIQRQEEMVDFLRESLVCMGTLLGRLSQMRVNDKVAAQDLLNKMFRLKSDLTDALDDQTAWLEKYTSE